jgi:hypothetical protein
MNAIRINGKRRKWKKSTLVGLDEVSAGFHNKNSIWRISDDVKRSPIIAPIRENFGF